MTMTLTCIVAVLVDFAFLAWLSSGFALDESEHLLSDEADESVL